ncbi:MAG: PhoU family transcriptional regulator [Campylobacteraceae bacterium]|jgi:phosphate transport system protein|nr:PhoU family transcriptional regulator [Campylobacteraceae bacterium]
MLSRNEEKLDKIRKDIEKFGLIITQSGEVIFEGLKKFDAKEFENAKNMLKNIETNANAIDNDIITSLALFGAEAKDLRELVSYLKITNELVRITDNIRGFAKNMAVHISDAGYFHIFKEYALQLYKSSISAVTIAIGMISSEDDDENAYRKVKVEESKSDDLYAILEKNILSALGRELDFSASHIQILSTMRKLEKMADRSVAVAKLVLYAKSGGEFKLY